MLDCQLPEAVDLAIHPVAARIGARIDNITLDDRLPGPAVEAIKSALAKYRVLFFRNQHHLNDAGQEAFTALLGELSAPPAYPARSGTVGILDLDSREGRRADRWHSDGTFVASYPKISVLRAVVIPSFGGDTV